MPTAIKHRPMSEILAPAADSSEKTANVELTPVVEEPAAPKVPEKYDGKTVEQVIEMHQNAESRLGQIQNEVGTLRGLVTDLSQLQRNPVVSEPAPQEPVNVSGDEMILDPVGAITKVVAPAFAALKEESEANRLDVEITTASQALVTDFGDIDAVVNTPEFQSFATRTAGRQADFNTAAKGKGLDQVRAARRLLEDYSDFQSLTSVTEEPVKIEPTPTELAKAVSTEGAGPAGSTVVSSPIYESDVIALLQSDPAKYRSPSYQTELMSAIKEGRFVKNT